MNAKLNTMFSLSGSKKVEEATWFDKHLDKASKSKFFYKLYIALQKDF